MMNEFLSNLQCNEKINFFLMKSNFCNVKTLDLKSSKICEYKRLNKKEMFIVIENLK